MKHVKTRYVIFQHSIVSIDIFQSFVFFSRSRKDVSRILLTYFARISYMHPSTRSKAGLTNV